MIWIALLCKCCLFSLNFKMQKKTCLWENPVQICSSTTQHIPVFITLLPLCPSECHVYFVSANYNVWMNKDNRQYSQDCCHWPCWLLSCLTHSLFWFFLQCYRAHATHTRGSHWAVIDGYCIYWFIAITVVSQKWFSMWMKKKKSC